MTPAEHTRRTLLAAREEGVTFNRAWEQAMAVIPPDAPERRDWLVALEATRGPGASHIAVSGSPWALRRWPRGPDLAVRRVPDRANTVTRIATLD